MTFSRRVPLTSISSQLYETINVLINGAYYMLDSFHCHFEDGFARIIIELEYN